MLNLKPSEYYLNEYLLLKEDFIKEYFNNVNKYLVNDIPVQYILNRSYFYNYIFYVDENTLVPRVETDRKSTRLNSSHVAISYAVFCLQKKNNSEVHVHNQ